MTQRPAADAAVRTVVRTGTSGGVPGPAISTLLIPVSWCVADSVGVGQHAPPVAYPPVRSHAHAAGNRRSSRRTHPAWWSAPRRHRRSPGRPVQQQSPARRDHTPEKPGNTLDAAQRQAGDHRQQCPSTILRAHRSYQFGRLQMVTPALPSPLGAACHGHVATRPSTSSSRPAHTGNASTASVGANRFQP